MGTTNCAKEKGNASVPYLLVESTDGCPCNLLFHLHGRADLECFTISEYRIKGKVLPPADKENNLVILDENDDNTGEVSEIIRSVKEVMMKNAKSRMNEIPQFDDIAVKGRPWFHLLVILLYMYILQNKYISNKATSTQLLQNDT